LVGFAAILAIRKSYRQLAVITIIGLGIGALYVESVWRLVGGPIGGGFAGFYRSNWGPYRWPITFPFMVWVSSFLAAYGQTRWYRLAFFAVWPVVASLGTILMWPPRNRQRFSGLLHEGLFASMYTLFYLSFVDAALDVSLFPGTLYRFCPCSYFHCAIGFHVIDACCGQRHCCRPCSPSALPKRFWIQTMISRKLGGRLRYPGRGHAHLLDSACQVDCGRYSACGQSGVGLQTQRTPQNLRENPNLRVGCRNGSPIPRGVPNGRTRKSTDA
jgi:hypothetical protein